MNTKFLVVSLVLMVTSVSSAQIRRVPIESREVSGWCDFESSKEQVFSQLPKRFGSCSLVDEKASTIRSDREFLNLYMECSKVGQVRFSVAHVIDKRKKTCQLEKIEQRALRGSECGFTDDVDDSWQYDDSKQISLGEMTAAKVQKLPLVTRQQLIIAAKDSLKFMGEAVPEKFGAAEALAHLKDVSSGDEVYHFTVEVNGKVYEEIRTYPGDNSSGLIFVKGTTQVVATNGDDNILCALK